jgi:hypothetical protein
MELVKFRRFPSRDAAMLAQSCSEGKGSALLHTQLHLYRLDN